jgi:hypothetical protein
MIGKMSGHHNLKDEYVRTIEWSRRLRIEFFYIVQLEYVHVLCWDLIFV